YSKFTRSEFHGEAVIIGISRDITARVEAENRLNETLCLLRKTLGGAIQSIAESVEVRDPYTAGHQLRVANLGRAIATKMGLPQEMIEGIRIAGRIHDIGKIAIPAEILSKSTVLMDIEYEFIKRHPNVGFQILSAIEFPWPVAAMVYQHHERIDGTGYPLGLEGDMMLMESRVLAVADVVEAMATHRPYRPSLGLQPALEEITKNSGIKYDRDVVRACLAVINEDGFNLYDETYRWRPF
ncbi:MAG TPA: HD-GYP domain-containing protein, partial [Spirochaetes bacterium]|nr:HD-GYP domain-containing protein [Spirochaetota bacterium]